MYSGTRGCGSVTKNSIYHYWAVGATGVPLQQFLLCVPFQIDMVKMGIKTRGVTLLPAYQDGKPVLNDDSTQVYDVYDYIGQKYYPYAVDFYEEGRRKGFSRKIPTNTRWDLLSDKSMHYMIHATAFVDCPETLGLNYREALVMGCAKRLPEHQVWENPVNCTSLWYTTTAEPEDQMGKAIVDRHFTDFSYVVMPTAANFTFKTAVFLGLPMSMCHIVGTPKSLEGEPQFTQDVLDALGRTSPSLRDNTRRLNVDEE
jgi:hypothetical protein